MKFQSTQAAAALEKQGAIFQIKNDGAHFIIEGPKGYIDFWPTSGKWHDRAYPQHIFNFGLANLLKHIKPATPTLNKEEINLIVEDLIFVANHYEPDSPEEHELRKSIIKKLGGDVSLVEDP